MFKIQLQISPNEKIDSLNQVAEFHKTFNAYFRKSSDSFCRKMQPKNSFSSGRIKQLKQTIEDQDIVEIADALCDLQYVLSGAVLEFGLGEKFVDLFNEVQRSNMSKLVIQKNKPKKP